MAWLGCGAGDGRCERPGETPHGTPPLPGRSASAYAHLCYRPKTSAPKYSPGEIVGLGPHMRRVQSGVQAIKADPDAPWAPGAAADEGS